MVTPDRVHWYVFISIRGVGLTEETVDQHPKYLRHFGSVRCSLLRMYVANLAVRYPEPIPSTSIITDKTTLMDGQHAAKYSPRFELKRVSRSCRPSWTVCHVEDTVLRAQFVLKLYGTRRYKDKGNDQPVHVTISEAWKLETGRRIQQNK